MSLSSSKIRFRSFARRFVVPSFRGQGFTAILLVSASPGSSAFAQTDPWILAQQAMTRLDYVNALKYSAETLAKHPQLLEARRMAATAGRELGKFAECLKYVIEIPVAQISSDDVALLGDCSVRGTMHPRVANLLQQQLANPDNAEMAGYWLGRSAYMREDYYLAEKYLSPIQVLPDRLEKDRQRMLQRIRDVMRAQQAIVVPAPVVVPTAPTVSVTPVAPTQSSIVKASPMRKKVRVKDPARSGFYTDYGWYTGSGLDMSKASERISLLPFAQRAYEKDRKTVTSSADSSFRYSAYGEMRLDGELGFRNELTASDAVFTAALRGVVGGTGSNRQFYLYALPGEEPYPTLSLGAPTRGAELRVQPEVGVAIGKMLEFSVSGAARMNAARSDRRRTILSFEPTAEINTERVRLSGGYRFERIYGVDGKAGLLSSSGFGDLQVANLGLFALRSFEGFPLVRFASFRSNDNNSSREQLQFTVEEGDFLELNLVPRLHFDRFDLFGWYRFRNGAKRHFWSGEDARHKDLYNVRSLEALSTYPYYLYPTAYYETNAQDFSFGAELQLPARVKSVVGMTLSASQAFFKPAVKGDDRHAKDPNYYRKLIEDAGEKSTRLFFSLQWER